MDKIETWGVGFIMGAVAVFGSYLYFPPRMDRAEIFQRDNKPAVMRMYRPWATDGIYLPCPTANENNYNITLKQYLKEIRNEADRKIEEAEVKRAVGWHDE